MFDTIAEADQKLTNTIVLFNDRPVIVGGITDEGRGTILLSCRNFKEDYWRNYHIKDKAFEMKNLGGKLGYINTLQDDFICTAYTRRVPIRKAHQTQGLSNVNVKVSCSDSVTKFFGKAIHKSLFKYEHYGLEDTMRGKFPTLKDIKEQAKRDRFLEMSFHKFMSISKDMEGLFKLNYKNKEIGWTSDLDQFNISREWRYLDELFDESGMKVK